MKSSVKIVKKLMKFMFFQFSLALVMFVSSVVGIIYGVSLIEKIDLNMIIVDTRGETIVFISVGLFILGIVSAVFAMENYCRMKIIKESRI